MISNNSSKGSSNNNSKVNSSSETNGKLNIKEQKFFAKYIQYKWGISADDKYDMQHYFKKNIAGGAVLAAIGGTFFSGGLITTILLSWFIHPVIGTPIGINLLTAGLIMTPLCAIPFGRAYRIASIYRKTSGENLFSFLERTSIGGGYNWEDKEVSVVMAIRL